jgi:cytidylate kinase
MKFRPRRTRRRGKRKEGQGMSLITISGGMGSGAEKVAELVARNAKLELFDDHKLYDEAIRMGIRAEDLKGLDEKVPGFFDSLRYNPELYLDILESVVFEVSRTGKGVIVGHGSQVLLRDFGCAMHVLVHASEAYRVQQIMEKHVLSKKTAEKMIQKKDDERRGFFRFAFHMGWTDPSLYDLVINTEKLGIGGAAKLVLEAQASDEIKECSLRALETMERMSLVKKVQASLLKEHFSYSQFHVEVPEQGLVQISGYTTTEDERKRMVKTAAKVPGVSKVRDEIGVMPAGAY